MGAGLTCENLGMSEPRDGAPVPSGPAAELPFLPSGVDVEQPPRLTPSRLVGAALSLLLVVSAWLTMTLLALSIVVLAFRLDDRVTNGLHLHLPGTAAAIIGLGVMLALALGRVWLEQTLGIPSTLDI